MSRARDLAAAKQAASIAEIEQKLWEESCANPVKRLGAGSNRDEREALMATAAF